MLRKIMTYEDLRVPLCERRYEYVSDLSGCPYGQETQIIMML